MSDPDDPEDQEEVKVADASGEQYSCQVRWHEVGDEYLLSMSEPVNGKAWSARGRDLFDAFCALRLQLEPLGMRICVSGARLDVHPSGMSRSMGGGQMAYELGKPGKIGRLWRFHVRRRPPLVYIFSPAPCELVVSVAEQERYFEEWVDQGLGSSRRATQRS
jgi:hypothetical protein